VVLMDLRMPGMDGITATRRLAEKLPLCPVVILSAYDDPALSSKAHEAGAYTYLVKGCPARTIVDVVEKAAAEQVALPGAKLHVRCIGRYHARLSGPAASCRAWSPPAAGW